MSITTILVTAYILVWPIVVAGVLVVILASFLRELATARRDGKGVV